MSHICFELSESTVRELLTLEKFKEETMSQFETLKTETSETKAIVDALVVAQQKQAAQIAELNAKIAALEAADVLTPAQAAEIKADLDAIQATGTAALPA